MSVEEQLRSGFAGLVADPPPAGDRVAAVEGRVRRRARRRAGGAVVLTAIACLGVAGLTVLPAAPDRPPVAAEAPPLTARDLLRPMVAVRVDLGLPDAQRDAVVDRELQALRPLADNVSREVGEAREVLFTDGLDAARLDAFVTGVLREAAAEPSVMVLQVDGSAFELTAPMSDEVRAGLPDGLSVPDLHPGLRSLLGSYTVGRGADSDEMTLGYEGPALQQRVLDRVVALLARSADADPEDVRVRALPAD